MEANDPAKRLRLIQAAEELFGSRPFHTVALEEVARRANVGKGTIYLYFADKEDLFFQTAVEGYDTMCAQLTAQTAEPGPFAEALQRTCGTISGFFRRRRPLFRLMLSANVRALEGGSGLPARWQHHRRAMRAAVAAVIARGIDAGQVRAALPTEVLAEYLLGLLRTRAWELEDQPESVRSDAAIVALFIHGVAGAPAGELPPLPKP